MRDGEQCGLHLCAMYIGIVPGWIWKVVILILAMWIWIQLTDLGAKTHTRRQWLRQWDIVIHLKM